MSGAKDDHWDNWFYGPPEKRLKPKIKSQKDEVEKVNVEKKSTSGSNDDAKGLNWSLFEESLGCFNVFKRQRDALQKKVEDGAQSRVFSFEHHSCGNGARRFLVTTIERFWRWYKVRKNASFYEVIPDETPVRLFFDLEFHRESNVGADEVKLVSEFNDCLKEILQKLFNVALDFDKHLLILDASTDSKFSEHIIVHLPRQLLFPSCVSIKFFINVLENEMIASKRGMVFNADGTKMSPICDIGVYTLNRNFRLYLSSKLNKNNPLLLASRCQFYKIRGMSASPKRVFYDSLIVPHYEASSDSVLPHMTIQNFSGECSKKPTILEIKERVVNDNYLDIMNGYGLTSPFPILEHHILDLNRRWRAGVSVRTWKLSKNSVNGRRLITYYLAGCRFCYNVNREHRSNGVFWVVDLDEGFCYQKCFDVDCKGISSNHFPLPFFVRASIPSVKEIEKVDALDGNSMTNSNALELFTSLKNSESKEEIGSVQESLGKLRRRSAAIEKFGTSKAFDSFYDTEEDERLLSLIEDTENDSNVKKRLNS